VLLDSRQGGSIRLFGGRGFVRQDGGVAVVDPPNRMEGVVKFVVISRLAPGVENSRKALEVFSKAGLSPGAEATYAAGDGKTFINIIESDTPDMVTSSTYAPFFEKQEVFAVVPADETWLQAIQAAQANWD